MKVPPWTTSVRALTRRHGDWLLACALAALGLVNVFDDYVTGSRPILAVTTVLMAGALAWRRCYPLAVALAVAGALLVQCALVPTEHPPDSPFIGWLIAVYSVAAHAPLRRAAAGGSVIVVAVIIWAGFTPASANNDFIFLTVILTGFWIAGRVVRSRNALAEALSARTLELELEREERARLAVVEERQRIARELHDIVSHTLGVIVVQAGAERLHIPEDQPLRGTLESIERCGRAALVEMGRLLGVLRTDGGRGALAPQPGLATLGDLMEHIRATGLDAQLAVEGRERDLGPGIDVSAYRIIQEALTNAVRHSGAAHARVILRWSPSQLEIDVDDDGEGAPKAPRLGHGLVGIQERVSLYEGELTVGPSELGGFHVGVRLPLGPR